MPDTLWKHDLPLDPLRETKLIIPDSIFPKANVSYYLTANFLNSENESLNNHATSRFNDSRYHIITKLNADTLAARYQDQGNETKAAAFVSALKTSNA